MQYLGHKKLTTTQKYLKNVYLDDKEVALLLAGGAKNEEEKKEEAKNKGQIPKKRKRILSKKTQEEMLEIRKKRIATEAQRIEEKERGKDVKKTK